MSGIVEYKRQLRAEMKRRRKDLEPDKKAEMDAGIRERILALIQKQPDPVVYCYVSFGTEIDTRKLLAILWERKIPVAVPRVEEKDICFYRIYRMEDLTPGVMGIPEPAKNCIPARDSQALVITPGLAFTKNGDRIGYGGGYYDRFFAQEPDHVRIGTAYSFQLTDRLKTENTDQPLDMIVTEKEILRCR